MFVSIISSKSVSRVLSSPVQAICVGPENMQVMYPAIFDQLLLFVEFSCKPPQFGKLETKHVTNAKYSQVRTLASGLATLCLSALGVSKSLSPLGLSLYRYSYCA